MKKIKISDLGKSISIVEFRTFADENLDAEIYFLPSRQMCFCVLSLINFKKHNIENTEEYILRILFAFGLQKYMTNEKPIDFFMRVVLDFRQAPINQLLYLQSNAKSDLFSIGKLLKYYESQDFIRRFKGLKTSPRFHNQYTLLKFYDRTRAKYQEIQDYLIYQVSSIAIVRSRFDLEKAEKESKENSFMQYEHKWFPYKDKILSFGKVENRVDYVVDHNRLDVRNLGSLKSKRWILGYDVQGLSEARLKEYVRLKTDNSSKLFIGILKIVSEIPYLKRRKPIFQELRDL